VRITSQLPGRSRSRDPALSSETDFTRLDDNVPSRTDRRVDDRRKGIRGGESSGLALATMLRNQTASSDLSCIGCCSAKAWPSIVSDDWVAERLGSLVRVEESIAVADRDAVIRRATSAYRAFTTHQELRALYPVGDGLP
jgi:hypothetical protein